jgi:hypothetical protein
MRRTLSRAVGVTAVALALGAGPAAAGEPPSQQATNSNATAQVAGTDVDAPVRVASRGDNAPAPGPQQSGRQNVADPTGAAQVGDTSVDAPVRVLSDGDNTGASGPAASDQNTDQSVGSAQAQGTRPW